MNDNLWQIPASNGPETCDFVNHCCEANSGQFFCPSVRPSVLLTHCHRFDPTLFYLCIHTYMTGMEDSTTVVAIRDIPAGDEITIDYGTVNSGVLTEESDNFSCR